MERISVNATAYLRRSKVANRHRVGDFTLITCTTVAWAGATEPCPLSTVHDNRYLPTATTYSQQQVGRFGSNYKPSTELMNTVPIIVIIIIIIIITVHLLYTCRRGVCPLVTMILIEYRPIRRDRFIKLKSHGHRF